MNALIGFYIFLAALLLLARAIEHLRASAERKRLLSKPVDSDFDFGTQSSVVLADPKRPRAA